MPTEQRWRAWVPWSVAAAMTAALALRLIGLAYGLPQIYNPDEVAIMNRAMGLAQNGFNPHNFLYPSLYFYALFAWEGLWFVAGRLIGVYESLAAFERSFFVDPTAIFLAGRMLSVICGVLTVLAVYRLGARLYGQTAGVVAAVLLAVAPLAVRDAHYVKHDVPVTLLIVLTHVVLAADLTTGRRRPAVAGILAGLAMSTHYYALFVAAPVALVAMLPAAPGEPLAVRFRRLLVAAITTTIAFFAASPFVLAEPGTALRDIVANREIVVDRVTGAAGAFGALGFYAGWLARDALGGVTALLAIAGLPVAWRRDRRTAVLVFGFPVTFMLFLGNTFPASRYLNPVLPFAAVLAGAAASGLSGRRPLATAAAVAIVITAAAEAAVASARAGFFFRQPDTRTLALEWIQQHVPAGTSVLIQPYSVPLRPSRDGLVEALREHLGSERQASIKFQRQLALTPYPSPAYRTIYLGDGGLDVDKIYISPGAFDEQAGLEPLRARAVTHIVLKQYNEPDPSTVPLRTLLERHGRLLATFSPYRADVPFAGQAAAPFLHNTDARIASVLERPGPIIEIWTTH
jgi:hypothetical protein